MKVKILTNIEVKSEWLDELRQYVDWDIEIIKTNKNIPKKYNPYFGEYWGDFDWIRRQVGKADIIAFVTSVSNLRKTGIDKGHIGMYDLNSNDKKITFYIGIPSKKYIKATRNGFKYNFTYLMIHEYLHGEEKSHPGPDRVHKMIRQGRLKELLKEHQGRRAKMFTVISLLQKIKGLLLKKKPGLKPLVKRQANKVLKDMSLLGYPMRIVEGYRSLERQVDLYAQGRTAPGRIVTNAKPGESFHNYGVAVDMVFREYGYNAPDRLWQTFGTIAKKHGFEWGGDWVNFPDKPHIQMTLGYSLNDFQTGKIDWKKYD